MPGFGFLFLSGLSFIFFHCQGIVYPPSSGNEVTLPPGSTGKIVWTFDDNISDVAFRSWSLTNTDGSFINKVLARIVLDLDPDVRVSFPVLEVEKPSTLVLKNVDRRYDGKYKFSVDASTDTFSEVDVFIAEKPNATLNCSSPVTLNEGENFTCLCRGEGGNPPANVTWFKNGVKITDVGTERQTLNLLNVGRTDYGTYNCVATSYPHENYTDEESIQVTVNYKPVNTTIGFTEFPVLFNQSLTITCASNGFPKPNFIIYHNDTKVANDTTFTIPRVNRNHAGTYKCVASNFLGNDSDSEFLTVIVKPNVTINCSRPINIRKGDNFICQCMCKGGNPPANCTWYQKDVPISEIKIKNTLIHRIDSKDGGNYTCVGRSHARAQDKKTVCVSVYYTTIKFSKNPAIFNESVNMTCSSHGLPTSRYVIYHNTSRVVARMMTYTISRVNSTHAGTYKCVANNAFKNDSASEFLNVTKPTKSSTTIKPSNTTTTAIPSSSIQNGTNETSRGDKSDETIVIIVVVSCGGVTIIVTVGGVVYKKHRGNDNEGDPNDPKDPNGSKVIVNHYEMEEDQVEGGGNTYDTAKPPDGSGEGSHNNAEHNPPGSSLPPVYASVNRENRQGNTLYASLDSEALKRPSQKKPAENLPKNVPTEYASIDFMKTAKTPNDDSVST